MRIAVAGATGRVGRHVVEVLAGAGHEVVPMSRRSGVDLVSGKGLAAALGGVESIVDAANSPSPEQRAATEFFVAAARNMQEAGRGAGVRRIVAVSIIGIDRFGGGYMAAKVAHEQALRAGPIAVEVLRAAQFHEFVAELVTWGRQGAVSYVPSWRTQLVAARTAAEVLARLATAGRPPGAAGAPFREIAGPRPENLVDAARRLVARRGDPLRIEAGGDGPQDPDRALYETGALLPGPGATLAGPTFDEWLDATVSVPERAMRGSPAP